MLFADNPHDRQIEKLMSQIPNFKPRGHGIYIYEEKEYSAENCFCRECTYRRKKKRNNKTAPPCIEQRIRAGEVPLGEVLQETMLAITHPAFKSRLKEYIYETEIMYMEFKNERHHVDAYVYGEGEEFIATPEEVAYMTIRRQDRPDFLEARCHERGESEFDIDWSPKELFNMEVTQ